MNKGAVGIDLTRFRRDLLLHYHFSGSAQQDDIPLLRPKSTWTPDRIAPDFLARINAFQHIMNNKMKRHCIQSNLLPLQQAGLSFLKHNTDLKVWSTDKNLGPIVTTVECYIHRAFSDHLSDTNTYRELTHLQMTGRIKAIQNMLRNFVTTYHSVTKTYGIRQVSIPTTTGKFLLESLTLPDCTDPFALYAGEDS